MNIDHKGLLREGVFGWAWVVPPDHRPREFEVEIHNRLSVEDYTETLLHELWHVYQHVTGQLKAHRMEKILLKQYLTTK